MRLLFFFILSLFVCNVVIAQLKSSSSTIYNGVPWFDDSRNIVNAHGACIVEENGMYYLFGEYKTDSVNMFNGFSCYSSKDMVNWKFEKIVLPKQNDGLLGPGRLGERAKVMKSPLTGEYVMFMHTDNMLYKDPQIGFATCKTINGEYTFQGALLFEEKPIRKWDMGTFQDHDGTGYLLIHHGDIYRLEGDYRSVNAKVVSGIKGAGESPAMLHKKGLYYLLSSGLTSWERNDNIYHTAENIEGPWVNRGTFCPEGSLTYNSQCSFVLPVPRDNDTLYMYMGDRWSFPKQAQAATQVWLPLDASDTKLTIPAYWERWDFNTFEQSKEQVRVVMPDRSTLKSNQKQASLNIPYDGIPLAVLGTTAPDGGYAKISITNPVGDTVHCSFVDFYSKVPDTGLRFVTPQLVQGSYKLSIEATGEHGVWWNKRGNRFGSSDFWIRVHQFVVYSP
ncbi:family 43 glycosylhydrolase [Sphingobacterium sp. LRF_L2]|uniref:family 43 glycosylhydrolase n=1 Tax=Sphingobacterium sp. LRF_L2 TaxID=3369421 RepID=UPI003F602F04